MSRHDQMNRASEKRPQMCSNGPLDTSATVTSPCLRICEICGYTRSYAMKKYNPQIAQMTQIWGGEEGANPQRRRCCLALPGVEQRISGKRRRSPRINAEFAAECAVVSPARSHAMRPNCCGPRPPAPAPRHRPALHSATHRREGEQTVDSAAPPTPHAR